MTLAKGPLSSVLGAGLRAGFLGGKVMAAEDVEDLKHYVIYVFSSSPYIPLSSELA